MKIFSFLLAVAFAGVCLGAEPAATPQTKEPTYQGKTLSEWTALTKDKDETIRASAAYALGEIGPEAKIAVPAIIELVKDKSDFVRETATQALANIGPAAKIAIPTIAELLKNKYAGVRADAANALWHFGPDAKIAIPAIAELLKDEYAWVRGAAADALSHFGPDAKSTIPAITELLKDQLQKQPGHWSAFWIMGDGVNKVGSGGRDGTEIDIYEKPWLDDRVQQTLHWDGYGKDHKTVGNVAKVSGVMEGWHTFGLWWKPDEYIFYVDGKETWRTKASGVCQVPEYIKLSDEIGDWAGDIKKATLPDAFLVDYVRVYDVVEKQPTTEAAKAQIERLDLGVQMYELDIGTYPTTQQGLQSLRTPPPDLPRPDKWEGPYLVKDVPLDPWGKPYHYRCPGVHNPDTFDVWSVGPDGKEIGNWTPNVVEKK